jgi:hypothetical protein
MNLEFEVENEDIRPEFEVLKPYFAKALSNKYISVSIYAEIEKDQLLSQSAVSEDINKINKEVIEGVRFRFVAKTMFGKAASFGQNILDVNQVQSEQILYESGDELLADVLKHSQYKHSRQLQYLADKHAGNLLKIRFVLQPFSFVFLLEGTEQLHVVLETLDTEEASYLWHFEKNISGLPSYLKEIDRQLDIIRKLGRQGFLTAPPENFSRIVHDYSNEQKGFIVWKGILEERLV